MSEDSHRIKNSDAVKNLHENFVPSAEWRVAPLRGADHKSAAGWILTDGLTTRAIFNGWGECTMYLSHMQWPWVPAEIWHHRDSEPLGVTLSITKLEDLVLRVQEREWLLKHKECCRAEDCWVDEGPATPDGALVLSRLYWLDVQALPEVRTRRWRRV